MMNHHNHRRTFILIVGIFSSSHLFLANGAIVKRVTAGKVYNEHDPVYIVVNKVGYVVDDRFVTVDIYSRLTD